MAWDYEMVRKNVEERYEQADLSKEQLLKRVVDLEVASTSFYMTLGALTTSASRGTNIVSKLFVDYHDNGGGEYYDRDTNRFVTEPVTESNLHVRDFMLHDSFTVMNPDKLDDSLKILSSHSSETAATIYHGSISMFDIRNFVKIKERNLYDYRESQS